MSLKVIDTGIIRKIGYDFLLVFYTVTLKTRLGSTQGHRKRHGSIRRLWLPIDVP